MLDFYCPQCGRKTSFKEEQQPLGKKKQCKGCGEMFWLTQVNTKPPTSPATLDAKPSDIAQTRPDGATEPIYDSAQESFHTSEKTEVIPAMAATAKAAREAATIRKPAPGHSQPGVANPAETTGEEVEPDGKSSGVPRLKSLRQARSTQNRVLRSRGSGKAPREERHREDYREPEERGWFFVVWHMLFSLEGRVARWRYFLNSLYVTLGGACLLFVVIFLLSFLMQNLGSDKREAAGPLAAFVLIGFYAFILWGSICQGVKRLHDLDQSGLFYLFFLVPIANIALGLALLFMPGTKGPNRYGDDPLGREAEAKVDKQDLEAFD
jgi:uncharacterized membrane protein YhaH (DUF805 family)/ribosomal protein L33